MAKCLAMCPKDLETLMSTASSAGEVVKIKSITHIQKAVKNKWLRSWIQSDKFDVNETADAFVARLAAQGTDVQVRAFVRSLEPVDCAGFVQFRTMFNNGMDLKPVFDMVVKQLSMAAQTLGVGIVGSPPAMAQMILDEYSHWTSADVMKFFTMAANSEFKGDMQHLTVRGLSFEFFTDWVKQYEALRSEGFAEINQKLKTQKNKDLQESSASIWLRAAEETEEGVTSAADLYKKMQIRQMKETSIKAAQSKIEAELKAKFRDDLEFEAEVVAYNYILYPFPTERHRAKEVAGYILEEAMGKAKAEVAQMTLAQRQQEGFSEDRVFRAYAKRAFLDIKMQVAGYLSNKRNDTGYVGVTSAIKMRMESLGYSGDIDTLLCAFGFKGYDESLLELSYDRVLGMIYTYYRKKAVDGYLDYVERCNEEGRLALKQGEYAIQYLNNLQARALGWNIVWEKYKRFLDPKNGEEC